MINPVVSQIALLSGFGFGIMMATTLQDVAVDDMAVGLLQAEEGAKTNALMFGGQAIDIAAGGAVGRILVVSYGLVVALLAASVFLALVLSIVVVLIERPGEKRFPWSNGRASTVTLEHHQGASLPILRRAFKIILPKHSIVLIFAMVLIYVSWVFFLALCP